MEWQRTLSQSDSEIDARFTALDLWSPIVGPGWIATSACWGWAWAGSCRAAGSASISMAAASAGQTWTQTLASWSTSF